MINYLNISMLLKTPLVARTLVVHCSEHLPRFGARICCQSPRYMRLAIWLGLRYQIVMNDDSVESLASKLAEAVPEGLRSMREDLENNFRAVLRSSLSKLDLVTRDEFEVQAAVLAKTRDKLEALEARLKEMEKT
jgi:BMFP domain-containing protein YqiC